MTTIKVWDPLLRLLHWVLAAGFVANALFVDDDSDAHVVIGFLLAGVVVVRLVWGFVGPRHARFADFPPDPVAAAVEARALAIGRRPRHIGHSPLGALMIYNLLAGVAGLCLTGIILILPETVAGADPEWAEDLHEALVVWVGFSAAVHVIAVIAQSRRSGVNLVRAMLTGRKRFPDD